jgi:hypothetical protein
MHPPTPPNSNDHLALVFIFFTMHKGWKLELNKVSLSYPSIIFIFKNPLVWQMRTSNIIF